MKFIVEDMKGMHLNIKILSSNRIEIEGKDLEVRILLYDIEEDKMEEFNLSAEGLENDK